MIYNLQYLWPDSDAPRYVMAMTSSAAFGLATAAAAWVMRIWLKRLNRKLEQSGDQTMVRFAY